MATAIRPLTAAASSAHWGKVAMVAFVLLFIAPVAIGLAGTVLPAFGILPETSWRRVCVLSPISLRSTPGVQIGCGVPSGAQWSWTTSTDSAGSL